MFGELLDPKTEPPLVGRRQTRLVRRVPAVLHPFNPWGLVPAVGLGLVLLVGLVAGAGSIEATAEKTAQRALDKLGAEWAQVRASGQVITLTGQPPSTTDAGEAVDAVESASTWTWLGPARPVTRVIANWGGPGLGAMIEVTPEARIACDNSLAEALGQASIAFDTASSRVGASSNALLDRVADAAKACPGVLRIEGHTDDQGQALANAELSLRRAAAVRTALVARGVPEDRLEVQGFGASRPVAGNDTEAGRERNRRIEIRVAPAQQ